MRAAQADLPRTAGASVPIKTLACSGPGDNSSNPLPKDLCAVVGELCFCSSLEFLMSSSKQGHPRCQSVRRSREGTQKFIPAPVCTLTPCALCGQRRRSRASDIAAITPRSPHALARRRRSELTRSTKWRSDALAPTTSHAQAASTRHDDEPDGARGVRVPRPLSIFAATARARRALDSA